MTNRCKCPDCFGLAEYMEQLTGKSYGLVEAENAGLDKPHAPRKLVRHCGYLCECPRCIEVKRERQRARPAPRQPWEIAA